MSRRTRIVATLGPATDPPDVLRRVLAAGVDVARINFSHGTADEHLARIARLRETAAGLNRNVAVLADLPGPKLRVRLPGPRELAEGDEVRFGMSAEPTNPDELVLTEPELLRIRGYKHVAPPERRSNLLQTRTEAMRRGGNNLCVTNRFRSSGARCL